MKKFLLESNFEISNLDYKNVRKLYQPIIGIEASSLLMLFYDFVDDEKCEKIIETKMLEKFLKIESIKFLDIRKKLESFCLIKTFENKLNEEDFLIRLEKPSNITQFNKNIIYKNNLIKVIGDDLYSNFYQEKVNLNEREYEEISTKYIDYMGEDLFMEPKKINIIENYETINEIHEARFFTDEVPLAKVTNIFEAIKKYSTTQFIKYIWNKSATIEMSQWVSEQNKNGFQDESLNFAIKSCVDLISNFNFNYIKTVIQNLLRKNKISYQEIVKHFNGIKSLKKKSTYDFLNNQQVRLEKNFEEYSIFDFEEEDNISFEDLFKNKNLKIEDLNDK